MCGTAALAVTSGAIVLVNGAAPTPRATTAALQLPTDVAPVAGPVAALVEPVTAEPRVVDAADLVKGVRRSPRPSDRWPDADLPDNGGRA